VISSFRQIRTVERQFFVVTHKPGTKIIWRYNSCTNNRYIPAANNY